MAAPAQLTQELERRAQQGLQDLARSTAQDVGKRLGTREAQRAAQEVLGRMNIPSNIPVSLPTAATPQAVADAAYRTGKGYVENLVQQRTGIPIKLPNKLSAKAIEQSITGLVPKNAEQALELGLAIGTQYAASAVTSLLVGAGIGSVVPGLGTIVGIGVALGVAALRGALKGEPPPYARECKTAPPPGVCVPPAVAPVDLVPWIAAAQARVSPLLAREQARSYCGRGALVECSSMLGTVGREAVRFTKTTIPTLNLPQLRALLPKYEQAPKSTVMYDPRAKRLVNAATETQRDLAELIPAMKRREQHLARLVAQGARAATLPMAQVAQLRWGLLMEFRNAALQYQNQPTPANEQWLRGLGQMYRALEQREASFRLELKRHQERGARLAAERLKDPTQLAAHERQILQFQCNEGNQEACRKLRGAPTTRPRPTPRAPAPRARPRQAADPVAWQCLKVVGELFRRYPQAAKCLNAAERQQVLRLCLAAFKERRITPQQAWAQATQLAARACARQRAA